MWRGTITHLIKLEAKEMPASQDSDDHPESASQESWFFLHYKSGSDHFKALLKYWKEAVLAAVILLGVLWAISEASLQFLPLALKGWSFYLVLACISVASSASWVVFRYLNVCPEGLEKESREAKGL